MGKLLFVIALLVSAVGLYGEEPLYEAHHGRVIVYESSDAHVLAWQADDIGLLNTWYAEITVIQPFDGDLSIIVQLCLVELHPRTTRRSDNKYISFRHWEKGFITDIRIRTEEGILELLDFGTIFLKDGERVLDYILDTPEDQRFFITTEDRRRDLIGAIWMMEEGIEALDMFMDMTTK